jgi:hypothetical protein
MKYNRNPKKVKKITGTYCLPGTLTTVNCHNMQMTEQNHNFTTKRMIFQKTNFKMCTKNASPRAEFYRKFADQLIQG